MHIPEGDPSLQARRKANRRLDQREELLEEALQLTIAHCTSFRGCPDRGARVISRTSHSHARLTESLSRSTARPPRSEYQSARPLCTQRSVPCLRPDVSD